MGRTGQWASNTADQRGNRRMPSPLLAVGIPGDKDHGEQPYNVENHDQKPNRGLGEIDSNAYRQPQPEMEGCFRVPCTGRSGSLHRLSLLRHETNSAFQENLVSRTTACF
jgi:hypothetical protein